MLLVYLSSIVTGISIIYYYWYIYHLLLLVYLSSIITDIYISSIITGIAIIYCYWYIYHLLLLIYLSSIITGISIIYYYWYIYHLLLLVYLSSIITGISFYKLVTFHEYIIFLTAFGIYRFCVVIRFFHLWLNLSQSLIIIYYFCPILILEKEPVFPFLMLSAKQGNYWYHFYNVFGMMRSLGIEPRTYCTRSQHSTNRLSRRRYCTFNKAYNYFIPTDVLFMLTCCFLLSFSLHYQHLTLTLKWLSELEPLM